MRRYWERFITEWVKGAEICKDKLATEANSQMYAGRLSELAAELGFNGWLVIFFCPFILVSNWCMKLCQVEC